MSNLDQSMSQGSQETRKPAFLITLCVLSFISIGWSLLKDLLKLLVGPSSVEEMREIKVFYAEQIDELKSKGGEGFISFMEKHYHSLESINNANFAFHGTLLIVDLIGLFGVIWMFRRKKLGFHLYIIYSLLASVQVYLFVAPEYVPGLLTGFSLFCTLLFVGFYALNLKRLH